MALAAAMRSAQIRAGGRRRRSVSRTRCGVRSSLTWQARGKHAAGTRQARAAEGYLLRVAVRKAVEERKKREVLLAKANWRALMWRPQAASARCGAQPPAMKARARPAQSAPAQRDCNEDCTAQTERRRVPAADRLDTRSSCLQRSARMNAAAPVGSAGRLTAASGRDPRHPAVRYGCAPVYQIRSRSPRWMDLASGKTGAASVYHHVHSGLGCGRSCAAERGLGRRGEWASECANGKMPSASAALNFATDGWKCAISTSSSHVLHRTE